MCSLIPSVTLKHTYIILDRSHLLGTKIWEWKRRSAFTKSKSLKNVVMKIYQYKTVLNLAKMNSSDWDWKSFPFWESWRGRHQLGAEIRRTAPLPERPEPAGGGEFEQDYGFLLSGLSGSNYFAEAIIPTPPSVWLAASWQKTQIE